MNLWALYCSVWCRQRRCTSSAHGRPSAEAVAWRSDGVVGSLSEDCRVDTAWPWRWALVTGTQGRDAGPWFRPPSERSSLVGLTALSISDLLFASRCISHSHWWRSALVADACHHTVAVSCLQQVQWLLYSMCLRPAVLLGRYPGSTDENTWDRRRTGVPVQGLPHPAAQLVSLLQHLDCCTSDAWISTWINTRGLLLPGLLLWSPLSGSLLSSVLSRRECASR